MKVEVRANRLELCKGCYQAFPDFESLTDPQERRESCAKVARALARLPTVGFDEC